MDRRTFIKSGLIITTGFAVQSQISLFCQNPLNLIIGDIPICKKLTISELYSLFQNPASEYHPFVRWWWNGDKVEGQELIRELHILKDAGIGGVEINPVAFPENTDDLGFKSLKWLGDEWISMLKIVFDEAKSLNMTCDLIVGSGWPFGAEYLQGDERAEIVVNYAEYIEGPADYEISRDAIFANADPKISSPFSGRKMELMSLQLFSNPCDDVTSGVNLLNFEENGTYKYTLPEGQFTLVALVKINGFLQVINGAPGAEGPVLNHFNKKAVENYFRRMSNTIESKIGPLSNNIRALFTDSMELEGANWSYNMRDEFLNRRGYDIVPFLPFILFKIGNMGSALNYDPVVPTSEELKEIVDRVRFDFEYTKAELMIDIFVKTYTDWCKELNVKSRAQAYGRGFFPLETSLEYDIPECESWTMTWLRHKLGEEMSEGDYRRGRAYTMINKYVSSAAHLKGTRLISCEEMTNTYTVFNMTLEQLKIGGDQTAISGVSHSVFHGFNYSPPEAPFPGWIRYGAYYNENNNWWKFFHLYTEYKARLSAVLQNSTMYADIAILMPIGDMWTSLGMQNEPFPNTTIAPYKTLIWEAINKCGGGCDYISESIIQKSTIDGRFLCYNKRMYSALFLIGVERINPLTINKIRDFVINGGKLFCIDKEPHLSLGYCKDFSYNDSLVSDSMSIIKQQSDRYVFLEKPDSDYIGWYKTTMEKYNIPHYLNIEYPNAFVMQNRYTADDGSDIFFICNSHRYNSHKTKIQFQLQTIYGKRPSIWDLETGVNYSFTLSSDGSRVFDLGPAESLLIVFSKEKSDKEWLPFNELKFNKINDISNDWDVEFHHSLDKTVKSDHFVELEDLNDFDDESGLRDYRHFCGTAIYNKHVYIDRIKGTTILDLGRVEGVSELIVNGVECGAKWYGKRLYDISDMVHKGDNEVIVKVTTIMGNYLKTLKDNKIVQKWVNRKGREQFYQSMGLIGPVSINFTN